MIAREPEVRIYSSTHNIKFQHEAWKDESMQDVFLNLCILCVFVVQPSCLAE